MVDKTKDIVVSSRIRLARNLDGKNFPIRISDEEAREVLGAVAKVMLDNGKYTFRKLFGMDKTTQTSLLEKHIISNALLENSDISGFCVSDKENIVVMINEEDHIREQCIESGFKLIEAYEKLQAVDNLLLKNLPISYTSDLGFLTACPSNVGTGLRASVMVFLPALTMIGAIESAINAVKKLGMTFRGEYGEGSCADGYLYQISNQTTLGNSEIEIINSVNQTVLKICEMENEARDVLFQTKRDEIKDKTFRAYGILSNSYIMTTQEFVKHLANLKLGSSLGLIEFENPKIIEEIEVSCKPANLVARFGDKLTPEQRDKFRADYLCRALKNQRK